MRRFYFLFLVFLLSVCHVYAQVVITGVVVDEKNQAMIAVPVLLKSAKDSTLIKGEVTDENGKFTLQVSESIPYFVELNYLGYQDFTSSVFIPNGSYTFKEAIDMKENATLMDEVVVSTSRAILEVKSDRTIFNVSGTINATGQSGVNLLRKAPGVVIDNNNNINVLGRSGVLVYVDGKRLPLSGDDLTNYLQSLSAEQIDRIEVITNPGAQYEAQGNAGIIDIKLKKDLNLGANGTISSSYSYGRFAQGNLNAVTNYRNKKVNLFANAGYSYGNFWNRMIFTNYQNNLRTYEVNLSNNINNNLNARMGMDYYISQKSTIGFLVGLGTNLGDNSSNNFTDIYPNATSTVVDSVLRAPNTGDFSRNQMTYNVNYLYQNKGRKLSIDLDHGRYNNESDQNQPNFYAKPDGSPLRSIVNFYSTPVKINISTAKIDYELPIGKGNLGLGAKYSDITTDNSFLFYNVVDNKNIRNDRRSNLFFYDENVSAVYTQYSGTLTEKLNFSTGIRMEATNARGDLNAFSPDLEEEPVDFDYVSFFPSAGLTYTHTPEHAWSLNYGRRINRPDYNVLNPFREQLSELSYSRGNKFLQPEKLHNIELGYTLKYMYSFKLAYSLTDDQITRLIGPDEIDPRAGFISWDNLARQHLYVASASLPFTINKWWSLYLNASVSYTDNQADYGNGAVVDVQAGSYNFFQQSTFALGKGYTGEISGWYAGPGVWGGVFLYDPCYSLDLGLQKRFLKKKLNVRLSVQDVTYQSGWSGESKFNGLQGIGRGNWDSRRASLSLSYDLGNKNVKSRNRSTGLEDEGKRVSK
jgi:iron complex outermembrane recepter protein